MNELVLASDARVALTHLAAIGLASIIEDSGDQHVTLHWTATLASCPVIRTARLDWTTTAEVVRNHARVHAEESDWTAASVDDQGSDAGLLSPRIKVPTDLGEWRALSGRRREVIDGLIARRRWLDLRLVGALGEPAYWRFDDQRKLRPDDGASRWEMKTRNRGEDFVRHRLRKLASTVAARDTREIQDGLSGVTMVDELDGTAGSRTSTGLGSPGPTDNAVAWCALWGISQFPVVPRVSAQSRTAGHLSVRRGPRSRRQDFFCLPLAATPIRMARLRTVIASRQLADAGTAAAIGDLGAISGQLARRWLVARGIGALALFPIGIFGSASAPERRALAGTIVRLGE